MSAPPEHWVESFDTRVATDPSKAAAWLDARRDEARERFRERGFPTRREEAWKYTNPQRISEGSFGPAPEATLDAEALAALVGLPEDGPRFVFVNGRLAPEHSAPLDELAKGLRVTPLGARFDDHEARGRELLEAAPTLGDRAFALIADAFFEDALVVRAESGAQIDTPVNLIFVSCGSDRATASFPRVCVHAERESSLRVREIFCSDGGGEHLCNAFSQYHAAAGAALHRSSLQLESSDATFLCAVAIRAERDARVGNRAIALGARTAREDLVCELAGPGAECELQGLYLIGDGQHSDHHTTVDHQAPQCSSRQLYRGVMAGRSRGAFTGTVVVRSGAQQSDAEQKNQSLLLSEHAEADSKPQLEIYADDVKCSHGSTIGQLDPEQIFYLRSRGVGEEEARAILIRGFASAISEHIEDAALRETIDAHIALRLRSGASHE